MQSGTSSSERLTARTVGLRARSTLLAAAGGVAFAVVLYQGHTPGAERKTTPIADDRPPSRPAPAA